MLSAALAVAASSACTPTSGGNGGSAVLVPPTVDLWLAGDSVAEALHRRVTTPDVYNAAAGGTGFIAGTRGTIEGTIDGRLAWLEPSAGPRVVIVQGGINDRRLDLADVTAAMARLESDLAARGIATVWLTTPVGTKENLPEWLPRINAWMRTRSRWIDCDTASIRAAGFKDGIHPTDLGYERYAACLDQALPGVLSSVP